MKFSAEEKKFVVYMHTTPSDKKYIGITSRKPSLRWSNGFGYRSNKRFFNAILKHGWDNIEHSIVASDLSLVEATVLEKELIKKYNSMTPAFGYNNTSGGEGKTNFSPESRRKMKEASRKRFENPSERERMSEIAKMPQNTGIKVSYDDKVFDSVSACAKYVGISHQTMCEYLSGKRSMAQEHKDRGLAYYGVSGHYAESTDSIHKEVICNNIIYSSGRELEREYGLYKDTVREWLVRKRTKVPKKFQDMGLRYLETKRFYYITD